MLVSFDMYCKNDLFLYRNLFYAALMATAFEGNREELVHDGTGRVVVDETTGHHEHVGIVVLTNQLSDLGIPAYTGANALVLVKRHGDALTTAADGNARINFTALDTLGQGMSVVGIVNGGIAPCSIVLNGVSFLFEILQNELLQGKTSVIAGYSNTFYFHIFFIKKSQSSRRRRRTQRFYPLSLRVIPSISLGTLKLIRSPRFF